MKQCPFCGSDNLRKIRDQLDVMLGDEGSMLCECGTKAPIRKWDNRDFSAACDELLNTMIDSHAPNYNQHLLSGNDGNEYVITVQLKEGETPCQQLAASKKREAELVAALSELIDLANELGEALHQERGIGEYVPDLVITNAEKLL